MRLAERRQPGGRVERGVLVAEEAAVEDEGDNENDDDDEDDDGEADEMMKVEKEEGIGGRGN